MISSKNAEEVDVIMDIQFMEDFLNGTMKIRYRRSARMTRSIISSVRKYVRI